MLCVSILLGCCAITVFASNAPGSTTITYRDGNNSSNTLNLQNEIGTIWDNYYVYVVNLPSNSEITNVSNSIYTDTVKYIYGATSYGEVEKNYPMLSEISSYGLVENTGFSAKTRYNENDGEQKYSDWAYDFDEQIITQIPISNVSVYLLLCDLVQANGDTAATLLIIIQYGSADESADTSELQEEITRVTGENANAWHHENDRFNGKVTSKKGFWSDLQEPLLTAQRVVESGGNEATVSEAKLNLTNAIANLIPTTQVNATLLYEALHTDWRWYNHELQLGTGTPVSADNCTALTWGAYEAAKAAGQTLLDTLYDAEGNATGKNTADQQTAVDAAAAAADAHKLVNTEAYDTAYEQYRSRTAEAEALLVQNNPENLTESNYNAESWSAFTAAYAALKDDLDYRIVGGSTEDYAMLSAFPAHISNLKSTRLALVSSSDITVSFTYVNNFSALYAASRQYDTNLYAEREVVLTTGSTTLYDLRTKLSNENKLAFSAVQVPGLPGAANNNASDTRAQFVVFVNGSYYGYLYADRNLSNAWKNIQLHNGDDIKLVRIGSPLLYREDSSGYDSSSWSYLPISTNSESYYTDSLAQISMRAPSGQKVGDKASFSATVTGAGIANKGSSKSAENITLFIGKQTDEATLQTQLTETTAVTDASGNLQYVFRESGWYTVAMFNVTPDDCTTSTIYNEVTIGEYYSLYAGDFTQIYIGEADDTNALIASYRSENLAAAKAYYESFHDYDFTTADYRTFTSAYSTLKSHQQSAASFKELMDSFDED